jgi:hypothetical protein
MYSVHHDESSRALSRPMTGSRHADFVHLRGTYLPPSCWLIGERIVRWGNQLGHSQSVLLCRVTGEWGGEFGGRSAAFSSATAISAGAGIAMRIAEVPSDRGEGPSSPFQLPHMLLFGDIQPMVSGRSGPEM